MSTTVQRPQPSPAQPARAQLATNPYVGILAVFLGAVGVNAAVAFVRPCGLLPTALCEAPKSTGVELQPKVVK